MAESRSLHFLACAMLKTDGPKTHSFAIRQADSKTKSILFGLCHFHAIMMERKLYGPMGFNMMYPFSIGDLRDSAVCLTNYMENSGGGKIPWQDLKYIFGEIMYVTWFTSCCVRFMFFEHFAPALAFQ